MEIKRNGSRPSQKGPEEYFTGTVRVDPIIQAPEPSRVTAGCVTFRPGDVLWCPPGVKHWHGATPTNGMTHIAVQERLNGKNVD
jgi:quercetin dioxygenase-like cupin family protein